MRKIRRAIYEEFFRYGYWEVLKDRYEASRKNEGPKEEVEHEEHIQMKDINEDQEFAKELDH